MSKSNEKKVLVLTTITIIILIAVVVGATFAYFQAQGGTSANTNVNVQTATTDNLSFQIGNAINLTANQEDFGSGMGNKSGSTTASATLTANNATNNATRNYYVYLDITSNDFVYTTEDNQAELLLKVTGPEGEVTSIPGLSRKTSGGETGFDITSYDRLIAIADNYEITSTGTVTQEWQVEVIFVNLDSDQNANTGKTFSANLIIQEEEITTNYLSDYIINEVYTGVEGASGIYYHDGVGEYTNADQESGDNSYRYSGSNDVVNNYVCFGPGAESEGTCANDNLYRIIGLFDDDKNGTYQVKLIKSDYATAIQLGKDGSYNGIYSFGDDSYKGNNYVNIAGYFWNNDTNNNKWNESNLNKVNLNTNYINYLNEINSRYVNMITSHNYQIGDIPYRGALNGTIKSVYNYELGTNSIKTVYNAKIGLMYVSDYGYAASPENWLTNMENLNSDTNRNNNWMYMGLYEWTISNALYNINIMAFYVDYAGYLDYGNAYINHLAVRPVFYLNSSVNYASGNGTITNPIRVSA